MHHPDPLGLAGLKRTPDTTLDASQVFLGNSFELLMMLAQFRRWA
jgi:hypothetical protein